MAGRIYRILFVGKFFLKENTKNQEIKFKGHISADVLKRNSL